MGLQNEASKSLEMKDGMRAWREDTVSIISAHTVLRQDFHSERRSFVYLPLTCRYARELCRLS